MCNLRQNASGQPLTDCRRWYAQNTWFSNHQGDGPDFVFSPKMSSTFDACISESLATMNVGKESKKS
jgi:hypothetical protein